jgi:hypothetical protein
VSPPRTVVRETDPGATGDTPVGRRAAVARVFLCAVLAGLLAAGGPAAASAEPSATGKQALVLVRVLAYDRLVGRRAGKQVVIGVVRADGDPASRRAASDMAAALRSVSKGMTVAGKRVNVVEIAAGELLGDRLRDLEVTAVYLAPGLDRELDRIAAAARAHPCLTFSDHPSYLRRGLAVALGTDDAKRRITISVDLVAARAQGAQLPAELLRVAEVVRR